MYGSENWRLKNTQMENRDTEKVSLRRAREDSRNIQSGSFQKMSEKREPKKLISW